MSDVEDDAFIQFMSLVVFLLASSAITTAVVHLAYQFGFRLAMVPFVAVIEYSLLMIVFSIIAVALYLWDAPWLSISDLRDSQVDYDWDDEEVADGP